MSMINSVTLTSARDTYVHVPQWHARIAVSSPPRSCIFAERGVHSLLNSSLAAPLTNPFLRRRSIRYSQQRRARAPMYPRLSCRRCAYPGAAEDMECVVRQTLEVMLWQQWIVYHTGCMRNVTLHYSLPAALGHPRWAFVLPSSPLYTTARLNVHFLVKETPNDTGSGDDKQLADWVALRKEAGLGGRNGVIGTGAKYQSLCCIVAREIYQSHSH
ncbi:hypothetical protein DFH08DRAFT_155707 [Mycena albidolilacea]|uniref:Uncharacterized protein n=1 Tax=Mycena albidolilacea TaxID=1033008 RepID=A0AAD7A386_9AGAR|nr:hypothetical protein DFH08DRAFT_155707 [Mycena albidolilacea]